MRRMLFVAAALLLAAGVGACSNGGMTAAGSGSGVSLTGKVSSQAEGPMEGVLVSAKADGGTMAVTVVTDNQGRYAFPKGRLNPGKYRLTMRATGYDLTDPGPVDIGANGAAEVDLKVQPTLDVAPQMMNAEWFMSMGEMPERKSGYRGLAIGGGPRAGDWPDSEPDKAAIPAQGVQTTRLDMFDKDRCSFCHSLYFVVRNGHDAKEWVGVLNRMRFHAQGGSPTRPDDQARSPRLKRFWGPMRGGATDDWTEEGAIIPGKVMEQAAYLASINLSDSPDGKWKYPLKTLPRPKGDETKVIITEYDLPRPDTQPHDVASGPDGAIWYQDFGQDYIGRLNPKTGEVKEWPVPALRSYPPFSGGGLDVEVDREGNPWFTLKFRGALLKFDRKTEKMTIWDVSDRANLNTFITMVTHSPNTNMVWFAVDGKAHGLDLTTNQVTKSWPLTNLSMYGFGATSKGNLVVFGFSNSSIHELDTTTGKITTYQTPTPEAAPRRGHVDAQDRAWFAEYWSGGIGMFDSNTKQIKEWPLPAPYADPYDVVPDKNGEAWAGGMLTDYIFRLNPSTGKVTKYLLPKVNANIRRMDVDNSTTPPSVWAGENHHGKIFRMQVLERQDTVKATY